MVMLKPDEYYESVLDISPAVLRVQGFKGVLLDLDNTLQPRGQAEIPAEITAWVAACKRSGLLCCLVSNTRNDRVQTASRILNIGLVSYAFKPFTSGYRKACKKLGLESHDVVMIGDQSYTDILGAHAAGIHAIMVKPLSDQDLAHTRLLRTVDAWAVRNMEMKHLALPESLGLDARKDR